MRKDAVSEAPFGACFLGRHWLQTMSCSSPIFSASEIFQFLNLYDLNRNFCLSVVVFAMDWFDLQFWCQIARFLTSGQPSVAAKSPGRGPQSFSSKSHVGNYYVGTIVQADLYRGVAFQSCREFASRHAFHFSHPSRRMTTMCACCS